jgi:hypothetical protein
MFCVSVTSPPLTDVSKELGSSGKCNCHIKRDVRANAHKDSRYANTLLVSFNNRVYSREHASSVFSTHVECCESSRLEAASRHIHQVGLPVRTATVGNSSQPSDTVLSHTIELEGGKGDVVSINLEP